MNKIKASSTLQSATTQVKLCAAFVFKAKLRYKREKRGKKDETRTAYGYVLHNTQRREKQKFKYSVRELAHNTKNTAYIHTHKHVYRKHSDTRK